MPAHHIRLSESRLISVAMMNISEAVTIKSTLFQKIITLFKTCVYIHYRVRPSACTCLNNPKR